ncbi:hypothetical protein R4172_00180 [Rhodococcus kroppenstedtii]|uniref:hypothetical protein n=1 Tax=Rhodococcoides kroppenstedtii TaxID=293050 RepID=UPI002953A134|nr:hypothetical protein [Rhodococcus kroppenstedtii]MDV7195973.1 hypothetical protein [Rhodococcus kroppenstedtii]
MNVKLETELLADMEDDWMSFWGFHTIVSSLTPEPVSPEDTARVIETLLRRGLITLGQLAWNDVGREVWDVPPGVAMGRIRYGHNGKHGYASAPSWEHLMTTEVMRANLTPLGEERLTELASSERPVNPVR